MIGPLRIRMQTISSLRAGGVIANFTRQTTATTTSRSHLHTRTLQRPNAYTFRTGNIASPCALNFRAATQCQFPRHNHTATPTPTSPAPAPIIRDPTPAETTALFHAFEAKFPSATLDPETWYLVAASTLVSCTPTLIAPLYTHLITQPAYTTPSSRQRLMRRLREALVKSAAITGFPKVVEAVFAVAELEREEDRDYSFSRAQWVSGEENRKRGREWLGRLYQGEAEGTVRPFEWHQDVGLLCWEVVYGLCLSDQTILTPVQTELVVVSGIMIQNLPLETGWHLRGARRLGVSPGDLEAVQQCVEMVAEFAGVRVDKLPRVGDIEHEV